MDAAGVVRADRIEASQLKGRRVYGPDGKLIGTVQDLVLSVADGSVLEVIVWFSGSGQSEASYYSVPWKALRAAGDNRGYVVDRAAAVPMARPVEAADQTSEADPDDGAGQAG
ncbi:PRC-barrel domain-containing protein [Antarcticirhabdus aurantiaca]|uniref:PRC-barrel domain-containing protein n=2 Tax=Antarcticirhabdus aurantiaca TaxID=2606717 RepID=A0ACD4NHU9_9HYPH|nr:PRC-barrel domain-containing protein [Jeongeuplla avenae]